jgi:uncharacterized protein (DUF433 family)
MKENTDLLLRITSNPSIYNGVPIIRGIRFSVADLFGHLSVGMTNEELLLEFPFLEKEDIKAALIFASQKINHPTIFTNSNAA